MLVLIGRSWVGEFKTRHEAGERDYVRTEIESALKRKIPVVPVLLGDAPVPKAVELPETIRPLLELQAARLQRANFDSDAENLARGVARSIALARGEVVASSAPLSSASNEATRYQTNEPINIAAAITYGVSDGRFEPGAGRTQWFKDIEVGPEMVIAPAGAFTMGSYEYEDETPLRKVTFSSPFAVGRFAVTFAEWDVAGLVHKPGDQGWARGRRPVINVSWKDARAYAAWLSRQTSKDYRLLSEAEWEFCCRAGTTTRYTFGDSITHQQGQFSVREWGDAKKTAEVGSFQSNPWGLYDTHGNVWEWCEDNWHPNYSGAPQDGSVWQGGDASQRVLRGGSWSNFNADYLRSAGRLRNQQDKRDYCFGFRLARTL
jgi:formylglycine-generating enzyme required for sulfatase activity